MIQKGYYKQSERRAKSLEIRVNINLVIVSLGGKIQMQGFRLCRNPVKRAVSFNNEGERCLMISHVSLKRKSQLVRHVV